MSEPAILIREFRSSDAEAFAALNLRWIEADFGVEDEDRRQLEHPQETIMDPGGAIAVAECDGKVVGTGALIPAHRPPSGEGRWGEIIKMATDPDHQGRGIASAIIDHLIEAARERGMDHLWLETNDKLQAATALYKRKGFTPLSSEDKWSTPYSRCNLQMVLTI
ncbi:transcriptional regulator, MarR family protein [Erythrobacter sp. NAP1]|uniref:GNAT family N-acetyltransferase n=1 Tax=Erythrobacter sp. NAP1 TaxID=237727 RepID=UPI0000686DE7|nr:GNAT family N-acetyltransferase [Erythrobacter sp. NAP1]EAQ30172.1 transcriptional regulator, MarR family protein [Erythrobacter sp. NAP1]